MRLITAAEALAEFKEQSGFGSALDHLPDNPLPHTLVVRPSPANTPQSMTLLREELDSLPETALVQVDTEWVQRFHAILEIVRQAIMIGAGLLGAAIIVIIGNTIRLEIQNRRDEIEVTKLIGASNAFVRRPFLWSGFWFGLFGSALALGLVQYGLYLLQPTVTRLAGLYQSGVTMLTLDLRDSFRDHRHRRRAGPGRLLAGRGAPHALDRAEIAPFPGRKSLRGRPSRATPGSLPSIRNYL